MIGDRTPPRIERLTETTLKPLTDRWIAFEGATIVLKAGAVDAVLLRYEDGLWVCSRHLRDDGRGGCARDARLTHWTWRGASYLATGSELAHFDDSDGPGPWTDLYETLLAVRSDRASWRDAWGELLPA